MKTGILATLLFIAAASFLVEVNAKDDDPMCPHEYLKNHPEMFEKTMQMMKEKGTSLDFSKLSSCSENQKCSEDRLCCKSPCGMKCMRPVTEKNAEETLKLILKDLVREESLKPYVETEDDKKFGMCPENYLKTHPEFKEKMYNALKNKGHKHHQDGQCNGGKDCPDKHKEKHQKHFHKLSAKPDCSVDGECHNQMRCCNTICGKKCMKPVFTDDDYMKLMFGDKEKHKQKRDLESKEDGPDSSPEEELDHELEEGGKNHGIGRGHERGLEEAEKGAEHGRGHGKGREHGKGAKNGKGHMKGKECGQGAKHGKGKGKGLEDGKGAKHGKGKGKGLENGKGSMHAKGKGKGLEHGKGAKHGKGKGKGLEEKEDHGDRRKNKGQVEGRHFREKRFAKLMSNNEDNNGFGQGLGSHPSKGEENQRGKGKKCKGKKNKKKCKGKGKGKGEGNENQN
ncbi:uncharacterized protein ACMZJ9_014277 [Mantella aurantiaca]